MVGLLFLIRLLCIVLEFRKESEISIWDFIVKKWSFGFEGGAFGKRDLEGEERFKDKIGGSINIYREREKE